MSAIKSDLFQVDGLAFQYEVFTCKGGELQIIVKLLNMAGVTTHLGQCEFRRLDAELNFDAIARDMAKVIINDNNLKDCNSVVERTPGAVTTYYLRPQDLKVRQRWETKSGAYVTIFFLPFDTKTKGQMVVWNESVHGGGISYVETEADFRERVVALRS